MTAPGQAPGLRGSLLTVDEAAETLRCSRSRVFELLANGTLARGARYGRRTVILAESVFAALEADYHPPAPPPKPRRRVSKADFDQAVDAVVAQSRATSRSRRNRSSLDPGRAPRG